jgi:hypothetical protein
VWRIRSDTDDSPSPEWGESPIGLLHPMRATGSSLEPDLIKVLRQFYPALSPASKNSGAKQYSLQMSLRFCAHGNDFSFCDFSLLLFDLK